MTWHLQPPVTPELCGKTYIICHQAKLEKSGVAVIVLDTNVVYLKYLDCLD